VSKIRNVLAFNNEATIKEFGTRSLKRYPGVINGTNVPLIKKNIYILKIKIKN
jgi:hypothetical protein